MRCFLSLHNFKDDCNKCSKCGKIRDEHHDWSKDCEKCSKCGKTKENQHDWAKDCEKCSKCGKIIEEQHDWSKDCKKCSKCSKTRDIQHNWKGCKCSKCSKSRDEQHDWSNSFTCKKCGKSAPMSFIDSEFIDAVTKGNIKMVLKAIESGVDISREIVFYPKPGSFSHLEIGGLLEAMPIKKNPLKIALENYQADVAKILLERGAILKNEHDKNPWNDILLGAAQKGSIDIALLALEKGAEVNCRGLHSSNPLILASVFGHVEIVKLLISKKSDLNSWSTDPYLPSRRLRTALMWASSEGHKEVVKILKEAGAIE